jgi:hypothetical protein
MLFFNRPDQGCINLKLMVNYPVKFVGFVLKTTFAKNQTGIAIDHSMV